MSARNMVRSLRDSGALDGRPPAPQWRSTLLGFAGGIAFGAIAYLGAAFGLPALGPLFTKPPPVVSYARPGGMEPAAAPAAPPFSEADALACHRYAQGIEKRKRNEFKQETLADELLSAGLKADTAAFYRLSAEITCVAQTRPMRLCDPRQRADLYARLKEPLALMQGLTGRFARDLAGSGQAQDEVLSKEREAAQAEFDNASGQMIAAFRELARRGLVSEADFAEGVLGAVHPVLAPAFVALPPVESPCPEA